MDKNSVNSFQINLLFQLHDIYANAEKHFLNAKTLSDELLRQTSNDDLEFPIIVMNIYSSLSFQEIQKWAKTSFSNLIFTRVLIARRNSSETTVVGKNNLVLTMKFCRGFPVLSFLNDNVSSLTALKISE